MTTKDIAGKCICGSIEISAKNVTPEMGACHCGTCRKWGAGPYLSLACGTDITISGKEQLSIYNSSEWALSLIHI